MGNYLTSQGYATQSSVDLTKLGKEEARVLYATNTSFRAEVDRLIAENTRLNSQHNDFISGSYNPLSERVGNLRTDVDLNNTAYTNWLNNTYGPLSTQVGDINTNFNALDSAYYTFLEQQYNPLSTQVGTLRTDSDTLRTDANELRRDATNLRVNIDTIERGLTATTNDLQVLQGQYTTLNNNHNNHISEFNKFSADVSRNMEQGLLGLENNIDARLVNYATIDQINALNSAVDSGLNSQEIAIVKSILSSNQIDGVLSSLDIQRQQPTQVNPASYLRTRNYMFY